MKKFIILLTAGTAFALASCASSGGSCCGSCDSKTDCSAEKKSCCGTCGGGKTQ